MKFPCMRCFLKILKSKITNRIVLCFREYRIGTDTHIVSIEIEPPDDRDDSLKKLNHGWVKRKFEVIYEDNAVPQ